MKQDKRKPCLSGYLSRFYETLVDVPELQRLQRTPAMTQLTAHAAVALRGSEIPSLTETRRIVLAHHRARHSLSSEMLADAYNADAYGAKHGADRWLTLDRGIERLHESYCRHVFATLVVGEHLDESLCRHTACATWNSLAIIERGRRQGLIA